MVSLITQTHENRVAVITGGTGVLGQAVVKYFIAAGAAVHVPWIVEKEVERLQTHLGDGFSRAALHQTDVTAEDQVAALFASVGDSSGGLDILCNIVGGFTFASLEDTDPAAWKRMIEMNATSAFLCCRAAAPLMRKNRWGRIVNVSAMPALLRGAAKMSAYAASKAAVLNLTQSLAAELVKDGITVNAICPTIIDTPANRKAMPKAKTDTWLDPAEIAEVIGFLTSDAAGIVTGTAMALSKG